MSIYSVKPVVGRSSTINEQFQRTYTRPYYVISDDMADDEFYIRTNLGVSLFAAHPNDAQARLKNIAVEELLVSPDIRGDGSQYQGTLWKATLEYGPINPQEVSESGSPEEQPIEVSIDGEIYQRAVSEDIHGTGLYNSAGDPYIPGIEIDQTRCTIKISQNVLSIGSGSANPVATLLGFANSVNSDTWFGLPPKTVKFQPPHIIPKYSQFADVIYFRVEYTFAFNPDTWDKKILDAGYDELDGSGSKKHILLPGDSQATTTAQPLDGSGHYSATSAVFTTYEVYPQIDFTSTFGFPSTLFGS